MSIPGITIEERVILFMDIHNYSMAVEALADRYGFLQEMYEGLGEIVVERGGEILKYMGDAMLCIFPAGSESEVVACSLRLRAVFAEMVERRGLPAEPELEVGIGSGEVAVGEIGHRTLRRRDVFGEEVNRTAKIGHHRGIAITERVYERVREGYETRRLPDLVVKWREEPLKVWEVVE